MRPTTSTLWSNDSKNKLCKQDWLWCQVGRAWKQLIIVASSYILVEDLASGGPTPPISSPKAFPRHSLSWLIELLFWLKYLVWDYPDVYLRCRLQVQRWTEPGWVQGVALYRAQSTSQTNTLVCPQYILWNTAALFMLTKGVGHVNVALGACQQVSLQGRVY